MNVGTINIGFKDATAPYFFGFQVQPLESRDGGIPGFLPLDPGQQLEGNTSHTVTIDVSKAGYQNSYDLYVYLYLNPEKVTSLTFNGMSITEFMRAGGKDIGLVGFNNLESLTLNGTSMQILPIWLKTLGTKLKNLSIAGNNDSFIEGPLKYFDYRDTSAVPSANFPFYTMVSYLTVPKKGAMINQDGNDWSDASGNASYFAKYIKNLARTPGTHFRQFSAMESLNLGNRVLGVNPRCDDVFPNLRELNWSGSRYRAVISGTLPRINNNGFDISYNVPQSGASGSIEAVGTSSTITDNTVNGASHISKYKIEAFNINGEWYRYSSISGNIGSAGTPANESEWNTWFQDTKSISIRYSNVSINLQPTTSWASLQGVSLYSSGGTTFKAAGTPLNCPNVPSIDLYATPTTGAIPVLGTQANTNKLTYFRLGSGNSITSVTENGFSYVLHPNFAEQRADEASDHKLETFSMYSASVSGRLRPNDFKYCHNLTYLYFRGVGVTGNFPIFPLKRRFAEADGEKRISVYAAGCRFYDLSSLDINSSNRYIARDLVSIYAPNNNTAGGGCKLPDFKGQGGGDASKITDVTLSSSLPSFYPSGWSGNGQAGGQYIFDASGSFDGASQVSGLTPNRQTNNAGENEDKIYWLQSAATNMRQKVLVNDGVRVAGGGELARVINVDTDRIYLDRDIPGSAATTFEFVRNTQDISNWFEKGFTDLVRFRAPNCRLSGSIDIRSGFTKIQDGGSGERALDLSANALTGYIQGFDRIFSGSNRKMTITLSYNNFSREVIRTMLRELLDSEKSGNFTNVRVDLNNTKLNTSTRSYSNYTQDDLFDNTIASIPSQTVSLTRTETVKIYQTITTVAEDGTETSEEVVVGSKRVTIPGKLISGVPGVSDGYYKTKTNGRQQVVEDSLGRDFNAAASRGRWIINLGFTYSPPDTTPSVTGSAFSNPTTREASLIEAGYTLDDLA